MSSSSLLRQIKSLPRLAESSIRELQNTCENVYSPSLCNNLRRVYLTGCGDSHHASVGAVLAFQQLSGLPCQAMTAMTFARYQAGFLGSEKKLVVGVSVSGQVSRTVEAVELAHLAGAETVALTGNRKSPLASAAKFNLHTPVPALHNAIAGEVVPGTRSYIASLLALYLSAIQIGVVRGHISATYAGQLRGELEYSSKLMADTVSANEQTIAEICQKWRDAGRFVFCGAGPGYGVALYSAAKIIEASGDPAIGQDLEEWAHLQYFERESSTPTFLINSSEWDEDRLLEVTTAATAIGRRVLLISPNSNLVTESINKEVRLLQVEEIRSCFTSLLTSLPGMLFAAYRAEIAGETYFRGFSGGRSPKGGGGISRIRTSHRITGN